MFVSSQRRLRNLGYWDDLIREVKLISMKLRICHGRAKTNIKAKEKSSKVETKIQLGK